MTVHASGEGEVLGAREFGLMKSGAVVLNPARGGVVNEAELARALDSGKIRGAWLDVFSEEPYSGPLTRFSQVIATPHIASYTNECRRKMEMQAVDNLLADLSR